MYLREYGASSCPKMLILHPMSITGEDLYRAMMPYWTGDYCIIAPDQGGHGKSAPYVSLQEEVQTLKSYLLERGYTEFAFLYGASMGTTVGYELLKDPDFTFHRVWFDGAGFPEKSFGFGAPLAGAVRLVLKLYKKHPGHIGRSFRKHYGEEFGALMEQNFLRLGNEDIIRVIDTFGRLSVEELPREIQERMHLEWGGNDRNYKTSRAAVEKFFPYAQVVLREGYGHCGYMAYHTEAYVKEIEALLSEASERETGGQAVSLPEGK